MSPNRELTSFVSRLANLLVSDGEKSSFGVDFQVQNRLKEEKSSTEKILRALFGKDKPNLEFALAAIFGLLIFKRGGLRYAGNSNWKQLAPDGALSDYWVDFELFRHFHPTAELPFHNLTSMQKLMIAPACFTAMHDGGVDWRKFQQVMLDFRALLPVLTERVKCGEGLTAKVDQGAWLSAIFPVIWEVEMLVTGSALSSLSNGRHRQISAGLPNGRQVEVAASSYFSNGKMPQGAMFAGSEYVTLLVLDPNNDDMRLSCEGDGMAHFQNRLLGRISEPMQTATNLPVDIMTTLPEIPEVPVLDVEVAGILKCVQAHQDAMQLHQEGLGLRQKLQSASQAQSELRAAQAKQSQAAQLVERLAQELAQARQQLQDAQAELETAQAALSEVGQSDTIVARLSQIRSDIEGKLTSIQRVARSLAEVA